MEFCCSTVMRRIFIPFILIHWAIMKPEAKFELEIESELGRKDLNYVLFIWRVWKSLINKLRNELNMKWAFVGWWNCLASDEIEIV